MLLYIEEIGMVVVAAEQETTVWDMCLNICEGETTGYFEQGVRTISRHVSGDRYKRRKIFSLL